MQKKSIGFTDALHYLYSTEFYQQLLSEETKWWYERGLNLYDIIEEEKRTPRKKLLDNRKLALFFVFCVENYKDYTQQSAEATVALFSDYRVFDFLQEGFDVLHTQGKEYIMEEIDGFLKIRQI